MYDNQTFEAIMARAMARIPSAVDRRPESLVYQAVAPAVAEIAQAYIELGIQADRAYMDTAHGQDAIEIAKDNGLTPKPATHAVRLAVFTAAGGAPYTPPIGARLSGGDAVYAVTEVLAGGLAHVTAETAGAVGNVFEGDLIPITHMPGLGRAELGEVLVPGGDAESEESLKARYRKSFDAQAFGGNAADYKAKVEAMAGVGGAITRRAWQGGGTVQVVIIANNYTAPSTALVEAVQQALDPLDNQGEGAGLAPIGHTVTVQGVQSFDVSVASTITLRSGHVWADVEPVIIAALYAYFDRLAREWADDAEQVVRISQIDATMLGVPGVLDVAGTTLNGGNTNIPVDYEHYPAIGGISLAVD